MLASAEPTPKIDAKILLMALAALIGCILRVLAVHGELWLDEAWSVLLVQDVGSPLALATEVRHDNNHLLNSLWLWLVGPRAIPEWQRFRPDLIHRRVGRANDHLIMPGHRKKHPPIVRLGYHQGSV